MITILHGDNVTASRNALYELKSSKKDAVYFDGSKVQISDLVQIVEGSSLFTEPKDIFIEDFFSKRKGKESEEIIEYLQKHEKESIIVFWEGKKLTAKQLNSFKKADSREFKLPQALFSFLDSLGQDRKTNMSLFHQVLQTNEPELVFFMLIRHFRILLAMTESSSETIDEVKRLAPWQISKLQRQARLFSDDKLKRIYKHIHDIDVAQKTGTSSLTLTQAIDFFLADL